MTDLVTRLRALDTSTVSDALDRHGINGVIVGIRPLSADRPIAGLAVTVRLGPPHAAGSPAPARHLGTAAIEASGPGHVIVVDHQGRGDCAGWGGLLSRAAAARGIAGVVVHGAARDVAEAAAIGWPVYARQPTPVTARGRASEHAWGEMVEVDGVAIAPGDLILADAGGVVVVPASAAGAVLDTAEGLAATESAMAESIEAGTPVSRVMGKTYEELTGA